MRTFLEIFRENGAPRRLPTAGGVFYFGFFLYSEERSDEETLPS
jgi:hypothetical protein